MRTTRNAFVHGMIIASVVRAVGFSPWCMPCAAETAPPVVASRFAGEVGKEKHEKVEPPSSEGRFRWDFSTAGIVHAYTFELTGRSAIDMGGVPGAKSGGMEQEASAEGALLIRSQGDGTAEFVLKDTMMRVKMDREGGDPIIMEQPMPPVVMQGMKEDGSGALANRGVDLSLQMLFPLPPKEMKVGETVDVPVQMPFNAMGSILQVAGRHRITLVQYVKIADRICAQLDVETDISEVNVPAELEGEYECVTKGSSVFYFDIVGRSFVSGDVALIMQVRIDAPMPVMKMFNQDNSGAPPRARMSMVSDSLYRVKCKK
jgi:hypothetical protein